ncbi:MAG: patatin-like phospholipase family protein [Desulfobacteraceae bacterium]|jgi:hypothetical protein
MNTINYPECPFDNIALSLSGGGVRAVGFHLGTMDYLDRIGAMQNVSILSSVSGGCVAGMGYAVYQKKGRPFRNLVRDISGDIHSDPPIFRTLLGIVSKRKPPAPSGRRSLMTALAQAYDERFRFCNGNRFGMFWNNDPVPENNLKHIIFNAMEYNTGAGFRFYYRRDHPQSDSGSNRVVLPAAFAREARLSDILAASTSLPVCIEPLNFPDDFRWPDDGDIVLNESKRKTCNRINLHFKQQFNQCSIPIMDGAVIDNQGISGVLWALAQGKGPRREKETQEIETDSSNYECEPDLLIVSDTPMCEETAFQSDEILTSGILNFEAIKWIAKLSCVTAIVSDFFLLLKVHNIPDTIYNQMSGFYSFATPLLLILLFIFATSTAGYWLFRSLRSVPVLKSMFMNRIRTLGYSVLLSQECLKGRIIANEIATLLPSSNQNDLPKWLEPTHQMSEVIARPCSRIPTKLSVARTNGNTYGEFDTLIACGHATICYNLIVHMWRNYPRDGDVFEDIEIDRFFHHIKKDWFALKKNAFLFVDEINAKQNVI